MFYSIRGKLIHAEPNLAAVECGGVAFACRVTANTARQLPSLGGEVMLYTILNVREDALELFGFADQAELRCFGQLTSVSGVGPKVGLAILSALSPERVALSIAAGDFKTLTAAPGVGPKLAQRIALELKDKVGAALKSGGAGPGTEAFAGAVSAAGNAAEALNALAILGFSAGEAAAAIGKLDSALPVNELVRLALKGLAR